MDQEAEILLGRTEQGDRQDKRDGQLGRGERSLTWFAIPAPFASQSCRLLV